LPIVADKVLGILLEDVDIAGKARVVVLDDRHRVLVLSHDLLDLLSRHFRLLRDFVTILNVLVELDVPFLLLAAWALEVEKLKDFFDTSVHFARVHAAATVG